MPGLEYAQDLNNKHKTCCNTLVINQVSHACGSIRWRKCVYTCMHVCVVGGAS